MKTNCAPVCNSCDALTVEGRCPITPELYETNAWGPGDLDKMFQKLTSEPFFSQHEVQILSSPATTGGPWVITMENVVSEQECLKLIELGGEAEYERSSDVGKMKPDGTFGTSVNSGRTSTNAWCQDDCYKDPVAVAVAEQLTNLTGIPEINSEYLQLLRYEPGQFYQVHHE
jgi:prolyl 4-hydroxylase